MARQAKYFKDLSRRDYIVKANEIVRSEGEEALSIRRIAREMNCSSASLYHYFENVDELLFYAEIPFLNVYLQEIREQEGGWKDAWDIHYGIWDSYTRAAFTYPRAFDKIFLSPMTKRLPSAIREYYLMFPEYISLISPYIRRMLETPDFQARDYLMCELCVEAGLFTEENAKRLNETTCMIYKGYLKDILSEGIAPEEIEARHQAFLSEFTMVAALLASDTLGHEELSRARYFPKELK